jgi:hypothetical protein
LPVTGRFKTANNLAHNNGIAAHPRKHTIGLFPPWRRGGLDAARCLVALRTQAT